MVFIPVLKASGTALLTAGADGTLVGYGTGTTGDLFPGASFGTLNFTPLVMTGGTLEYIYYDSSGPYLDVCSTGGFLSFGDMWFNDTKVLRSSFNSTAISGSNYRNRATTGVPTLVNGVEYRWRVEAA